MKKIRELIKTILDKPVGFAIVNCLTTLMMGIIVFRPYFEEGDDLNIAMIAEGAFGQNDYHLVYANVIYGRIISFLSSIISSVRWHTVFLYILSALAIFGLSLWLSHFKGGRFAAVIVMLSCFVEIFVSVQYTKVITFASVGAVIILLFCVKRKCTKDNENADRMYGRMRIEMRDVTVRFLTVLSYVVLVLSMLIRLSAFFIAVVFALAVGIVQAYCNVRGHGMKALGLYALFIVPVFIATLILSMYDSYCYSVDSEWDYYKYYNEARTSVIDYRYDALDYSRYGNELGSMGVSENDAYMYLTWQFADESVVTPELYEKLASIPGTKKINIDLIKALVANVYNDIFVFAPTVLSTLLGFALLIVVSRRKSMAFYFVLSEAVIATAVTCYYQYSGRWSHRIVYSMLLALSVVLWTILITEGHEFFATSSCEIKKTYQAMHQVLPAVVIVLGVAVFGERLSNEFDYQEYQRSDKNFPVLQMYMEEEGDTLFVADTFTMSGWYKYDVFTPVKEGALKNFVMTGGWSTGSPIEHEIVEQYGYFDPFDALSRGDGDVILIDNNCPDRKAIYISDHGDGPRVAAEYLETVCGYNLYQIK